MLFAIFSERTLQSFFTVKVEIFIKPGLHTTVTAMQAETKGLGASSNLKSPHRFARTGRAPLEALPL